MSIREWMNNNSTMVTIGAVVILALALMFLWLQTRPTSPGGDAYFFDTATETFFLGPSVAFAPVTPPGSSELTGVSARLYACGECPTPSQIRGKTVEELEALGVTYVYFERYPESALPFLHGERDLPENAPDPIESLQVRRPGDTEWVREFSRQGQAIAMGAEACPDGSRAKYCFPR